MLALLFFLIFSMMPSCEGIAEVLQMQEELIKHLMKDSSRYSRPVKRTNETIQATFGVELIQIVRVNDRDQLITVNVWVRQTWNADTLKWNASEWGGVKEIQIDAIEVWTPDIVLYNNGDSNFSGGTEKYKTLVQIRWDGKCVWNAPAIFISNCAIDISQFPFDKQKCILKFGSWTFDSKEINLGEDKHPLVTHQYRVSSEWHLQSAKKIVNTVKYDCCLNPYNDITFVYVLRRKSLYYVFIIVAPCFLLVLAVLFGFFLPPESGERISLTITILLAVAVFLQLVSDSLPHNSDSIPMLAIFFIVIMVETALSLMTTCIVLIFHSRGLQSNSSKMPGWMKKVFIDKLSKHLCIRRAIRKNIAEEDSAILLNSLSDLSKVLGGRVNESSTDHDFPGVTKVDVEGNLNTSVIAAILKEVKIITKKLKEEEKQDHIQNDWIVLARVIDRLFFWFFLLTIVVSCLAMLLPAYYVHN